MLNTINGRKSMVQTLKIIFPLLLVTTIAVSPVAAAGNGELTIDVVHENGNQASEVNALLIYQDGSYYDDVKEYSSVDLKHTFSDLPTGHDYTVKAYIHDQFAGSVDVTIPSDNSLTWWDESSKSKTITVDNPIELSPTVYHEDGSTPLKDAYVRVKSHQNDPNGPGKVVWRSGTTTSDGSVDTSPLFLYPTSSDDPGKYFVEVSHNGNTVANRTFDDLDSDSSPSIVTNLNVPAYNVDTSSTSGGSVDGEPSGNVERGTQVTLTADADSGYEFDYWSGDVPSGQSSDRTLSLTVDSDTSVRAHFDQMQGDMTVDVRHANGDQATEVNGLIVWQDSEGGDAFKKFEKNPSVAIPQKIHDLPGGHEYKVNAYINDQFAGTTGWVSIQNSDVSQTINVDDSVWVRPKVTYSDGSTPLSDAYVSIESHEGVEWRSGSTQNDGITETEKLWLHPSDEGYYEVTVTYNGQQVASKRLDSFSSGRDLQLTSSVDVPTYSVDVSSTSGGSVSGVPSNEVTEGTTVSLTASSVSGYEFDYWSGDVPSEQSIDKSLSLSIGSDRSVKAHFRQQTANMTVDVYHENGDQAQEVNSLVVWQDSVGDKPFKKFENYPSVAIPQKIHNLPGGHEYKVNAYINDQFAGTTGWISLQDSDVSRTIHAGNPVKLSPTVYYDDGVTPLGDAYIEVKSHEDDPNGPGKVTWRSGTTTSDGTLGGPLWLYPSHSGNSGYYTVDVTYDGDQVTSKHLDSLDELNDIKLITDIKTYGYSIDISEFDYTLATASHENQGVGRTENYNISYANEASGTARVMVGSRAGPIAAESSSQGIALVGATWESPHSGKTRVDIQSFTSGNVSVKPNDVPFLPELTMGYGAHVHKSQSVVVYDRTEGEIVQESPTSEVEIRAPSTEAFLVDSAIKVVTAASGGLAGKLQTQAAAHGGGFVAQGAANFVGGEIESKILAEATGLVVEDQYEQKFKTESQQGVFFEAEQGHEYAIYHRIRAGTATLGIADRAVGAEVDINAEVKEISISTRKEAVNAPDIQITQSPPRYVSDPNNAEIEAQASLSDNGDTDPGIAFRLVSPDGTRTSWSHHTSTTLVRFPLDTFDQVQTGEHVVEFKAIDPRSGLESSIVSVPVTVVSEPDISLSIGEDSESEVTLSTSIDSAAPIKVIEFQTKENGEWVPWRNVTKTLAPVYDISGETEIRARAIDVTGTKSAWDTTVISIPEPNEDPRADFSYTPASPRVGNTLSFVSESKDPDGSIQSVSWDFGDGTTSSHVNPSHSYDRRGCYKVMLTVTDDDGNKDTKSKTICLSERPSAELTIIPQNATVGEQVILDASDSTDPDGDIQSYAWDIDGDGKVDQTTESTKLTHTYNNANEYDITLTVKDTDGTIDTDTKRITVSPRDGTATFDVSITDANSSIETGSSLTIDTEATNTGNDSGTQTIKLLDIDGNVVDTQTITLDPGSKQKATLTWHTESKDAGSGAITVRSNNDSATQPITVEPSKETLVADAGPDQTVEMGSSITLDGSNSTDPDGGALTYTWAQTDTPDVSLRGADTPTPTLTAPNVGNDTTLTFELLVRDENDNTATDSVNITVSSLTQCTNTVEFGFLDDTGNLVADRVIGYKVVSPTGQLLVDSDTSNGKSVVTQTWTEDAQYTLIANASGYQERTKNFSGCTQESVALTLAQSPDNNGTYGVQNALAVNDEDDVGYVIENGDIVAFDMSTREQLYSFAGPDGTDKGLAYGADSLWYSDAATPAYDGRILELNPENGDIRSEINVGYDPYGLAFGDGSLWAGEVTGIPNMVREFSPEGELIGQFGIAGPAGSSGPNGLAYYNGSVWVGTHQTLFELGPNGGVKRSIDEHDAGYNGLAGTDIALYGPNTNGNLTVLLGEDPGDNDAENDRTPLPGIELQQQATVTQGETTIAAYPYNSAETAIANTTFELLVDANQNGRFDDSEVIATQHLALDAGEGSQLNFTYANVQLAAGEYQYQVQATLNGETRASYTNGTLTVETAEQSGHISGTVVDTENNPISGATVTVEDKPGSVVAETITGTSGEYTVELPPGKYSVIAEANEQTGQTTATVESDMTTTANVVLPAIEGDNDTVRTVDFADSEVTLTPDSTKTVNLTVSNVTNGIGAANLTVTLDNGSVATITDIDPQISAGDATINTFPEGTSIGAANTSATLYGTTSSSRLTTTESFTIATLTLVGHEPGNTPLSVSVDYVSDAGATDYTISTTETATVAVQAKTGPPAIGGQSDHPQDVNNDGIYEDLTGDGLTDARDVLTLWNNRNAVSAEYFDFNGDKLIDARDILTLWNDYAS